MDIQVIAPSRDIGDDYLFLIDGRYIRARADRTTPDSAITAAVEQAVEVVNFKFSCAFALDDSGDVKRDDAGANIIFAAEVHGISLEELAKGQSLEGWIGEQLEAAVAKAARKAYFVDQIATRYRLPAREA